MMPPMSETPVRRWRETLFSLWQGLDWVYERVGVIRPKLVATRAYRVFWRDPSDAADEGVRETVTFYLLQYPSGRRAYEVHDYGYARDKDYAESVSAEVIAWTLGGPLPVGAQRQNGPEIIQLKCIDPRLCQSASGNPPETDPTPK